jgi:hydroxymethylbilane synthase
MGTARTLRIGTRGSKLARWQSDWVAARLLEAGVAAEIVEISTTGDVEQLGPLAALGGVGVFTKEIQAALLAGLVDLAVHSLKDLPTQTVEGLRLAAVPPRQSVADALVARSASSLDGLPAGARVGTGSLRRRAQLLHLRPDLVMLDIRGNVDTRLKKLAAGEFDAIVLAVAGLRRLALDGQISEVLDPPRMLPAAGQGALSIECRADDEEAAAAVAFLDDAATRLAVTAERAALGVLHGGCSAPIGAWSRIEDGELRLDAVVADASGKRVLRADAAVDKHGSPEQLGSRVAEALLAQGAAELIAAARAG